jgi:DNA-3-methyladenine glycosylase II
MRFGRAIRLPVRPPFRLDLTVDALRRLPVNAVDLVDADGTYFRALRDESGAALVAVRAGGPRFVEMRATGRDADRWLPCVAAMLGANADLRLWYARSAEIEWLRPLASSLRGLKPPRYPSLWEACAHAVIFQQISLHAAAAIMRRFVEFAGEPIVAGNVRTYVFPTSRRCLQLDEASLRAVGLSRGKVAALRGIAARFSEGAIAASELQAMPTEQAAQALQQLPGIGPWSASVVLLRGLGRLDTFPLHDSGVARSLASVGGENGDLAATLDVLGPTRGMLYFHLLLGRLRGLRPAGGHSRRFEPATP